MAKKCPYSYYIDPVWTSVKNCILGTYLWSQTMVRFDSDPVPLDLSHLWLCVLWRSMILYNQWAHNNHEPSKQTKIKSFVLRFWLFQSSWLKQHWVLSHVKWNCVVSKCYFVVLLYYADIVIENGIPYWTLSSMRFQVATVN